MGLNALRLSVEGDDSFISVREIVVGCQESIEWHEDLMAPDIQGIGFFPWTEGSECGIGVVTYHIVPLEQRMRVEKSVWECFTDHRDIRHANDVSCSGRFTFLGRQVKTLPAQVAYTIVEGAAHRDRFTALIPWVEEKLGVMVAEAASAESANLLLHLGVPVPEGCLKRYGCNIWEQGEGGTLVTVYISTIDEYFDQVMKHELLHGLIPMGHLPEGNYLMSVQPEDPSQTHTLSALEEKLLRLYTSPYLRDGMTMEEFRRYLVIEE